MKITQLFNPISSELLDVEQLLISKASHQVDKIRKTTEHTITAGGKRLRPALVLLCAKLGDYQSQRAINVGYVIEYLHTATLVHDDIMDNAHLRRNRPSVNAKWGNHHAVLLGDYLFARSLEDLSLWEGRQVNSLVLGAIGRLCSGQIQQSLLQDNIDLSEAEYLEMIDNKTASLITTCCQCGALISDQTPEQVERLKQFGYNIGMAFQIMDDLLDYTAQNKKFGKVVGGDAREGNYTLPVIAARRNAATSGQHEKLAQIDQLLENGVDSDASLQQLLDFIRSFEGMDYSFTLGKHYIDSAKECLSTFKTSPAKIALTSAADYIIERDW